MDEKRLNMFYEFSQNNSFGTFDIDSDDGIGMHVVIEANSISHANKIAKRIGLYFDGSRDCPCCGNRWSELGDWSSGYAYPTHYGESFENAETFSFFAKPGEPYAFVHYLDGTIEEYDCTFKLMSTRKP